MTKTFQTTAAKKKKADSDFDSEDDFKPKKKVGYNSFDDKQLLLLLDMLPRALRRRVKPNWGWERVKYFLGRIHTKVPSKYPKNF